MSSNIKAEGVKVCCSLGTVTRGLTSYTPRGKEIQLGSADKGYLVSSQNSGTHINIVLVYDIFGAEIINTKRFADMLAEEANANVLIPDFFRGRPWKLEDFPPKEASSLIKWVDKAGSWDVVGPLLKLSSDYLRVLLDAPMGIIGFCWGGKQVMHACSQTYAQQLEISFKAGVSIHGAWLDETDAKAVSVPVFLMPSGEDPPVDKLKEILDKREFGDKCQYFTFVDEGHGFAAGRGDLTKSSTTEAVSQAISMSAAFFKEHVHST